jgi:hypothetical protein
MGSYQSSIRGQLSAFESEAERLTRLTLLEGHRRFRARLIREQMSKPRPARTVGPWVKSRPGEGISRKTGTAIRSIFGQVKSEGSSITLTSSIGGKGAYYVEDFEDRGLINFRGLFAEEATITSSNLAHRFAFLARNPNLRASVGEVSSDVSAEVAQAAQELKAHIRGVRALRKVRRAVARLAKVRANIFDYSGLKRA